MGVTDEQDRFAERHGLMVGITGLLYTCSVSHKSRIYLEFINGKWEGWRESYIPGRSKASSVKTIVRADTFGRAVNELNKYMVYVRKK